MSRKTYFRSAMLAFMVIMGLAVGLGYYWGLEQVAAQEDFGVEGIVVNSFTGNPVAGVFIEIAVDTPDKQLQVFTTGEDGTFTLSGLPNAGPYEVGFSRSQYRSQELRGVSANEESLEVALVPRGISTPGRPMAAGSPKSVYLDWPPNPELNVKGYNVYRSEANEQGQPMEDPVKLNGDPEDVYSDLITGLEYTDDTVEKGVYYIYQVQAISGADRPSDLSLPTDPPVKGLWLTIFIPDVYRQLDGLYLWEREGGDELVRIPVASRSAYDVDATSMEIRFEAPPALLQDEPFEVATTGITAGMMLSSSIQTAASVLNGEAIYKIQIAGAGVEERPLYGSGELFNVYLPPRIVEEGGCGLLHLIEDIFPDQDGVIIYSDPFGAPEEIELEDGQYCTDGGCLHGDVNMDSFVNLADAQYILDFRTGLAEANICYIDAWDINLDGRVTAADSTLIQRYVQGMPINPPMAEKSDELAAVSFAAAGALGVKADGPVVWMDAVGADLNETVEAPVYIENAPQLAGVTLTVAYDASQLDFEDARLGAAFTQDYLLSSEVVIVSEGDDMYGVVTVAIGGAESLGEDKSAAELVLLDFTSCAGDAGLIPATLTSAEVNDEYGHTPRHTDPMAPSIVAKVEEEMVEVPDLVGLGQVEAEAALANVGLNVGVVSTVYSETVPQGFVISQALGVGLSVVVGTSVDFVVSDGPEPIAVPDVTGMSQEAAEAALLAANLSVGAVTEANSEDVDEGDVISQNPAAGALVEAGTAVALEISIGPEPQVVAVPNVIGMSQEDAEAALEAAGLTVGAVTEANSNDVEEGDVISQNPSAGTEVEPGAAVSLEVSKGAPAKRPLPICGTASDSGNVAGNFLLLAGLSLLLGFQALRSRKLS